MYKNKLIEGKWSDIIPLPNGVNTEQDEAYPFFSTTELHSTLPQMEKVRSEDTTYSLPV